MGLTPGKFLIFMLNPEHVQACISTYTAINPCTNACAMLFGTKLSHMQFTLELLNFDTCIH